MDSTDINQPMTLVIADDHPLFRMGLRYALPQLGFKVVAEATDGQEALKACLYWRPAIALLDIKMPEMTGVEVCAQLTRLAPEVSSVLITTFAEPAIIQSAIEAGARGYVSKETSPPQLAEELKMILASPDYRILPEVSLPHLTPRELEILPLLALGHTNKKIALLLGISPETAKDHLANIYQKLNVSDRTEAVGRARDLGLVQ